MQHGRVDVRVDLARLVPVLEVGSHGGRDDGQGVAVQLVEQIDNQQRAEDVQRVEAALFHHLPHAVARDLLLVPAEE